MCLSSPAKVGSFFFLALAPEAIGRTLAIEEPRAVLARECKGLWEFANKFDDLRDMILVLAVPRPRLRVKEVIPASEEFK
jgi:hypothetical protein